MILRAQTFLPARQHFSLLAFFPFLFFSFSFFFATASFTLSVRSFVRSILISRCRENTTKRHKLTKVLKVLWSGPSLLFMAFSEFLRDFNGTVTCLIYEKFPGSNSPSVNARISFVNARRCGRCGSLERTVGISLGEDCFEKSIVLASFDDLDNTRRWRAPPGIVSSSIALKCHCPSWTSFRNERGTSPFKTPFLKHARQQSFLCVFRRENFFGWNPSCTCGESRKSYTIAFFHNNFQQMW